MSQTSYAVKMYEGMGRGLVALHGITKGTLIKEEEILLLNSGDTDLVNMTALRYYTFKVNNTCDCLVLGDGELYNHAPMEDKDKFTLGPNANVGYQLVYDDLAGRHFMRFYALRDIESGEQLFIDYNADTNVNVETYKTQRSLI